jgi:two-component system, chemotaxis family, protein-glutamate methylesterase/glutaminase
MSATASPSPIEAIAIGASAGGVEALTTLLPALPADLPAAVFVVIHLPRERPSLLAEVFRARCTLPVVEALDKEPVRPGHVYIAPPDYHLLLDQGPQLALSVDALQHFSRPSIDVLFESAADVYGPRLLALLLTGANEDGAAGLQSVRRAGGCALVQTPEEAYASAMPAAALRAGPVDGVMPLLQLAHLLSRISADALLPTLLPSAPP